MSWVLQEREVGFFFLPRETDVLDLGFSVRGTNPLCLRLLANWASSLFFCVPPSGFIGETR